MASSTARSRKKRRVGKRASVPRKLHLQADDPAEIERVLFPRNPYRRTRIQEFIDNDHAVMTRWYDLLERDTGSTKDARALLSIMDDGPEFLDPYVELSTRALDAGEEQDAFEIALTGYMTAVAKIADRNGRWPQVMAWGAMSNRHIMRAIYQFAWVLWHLGQPEPCAMILRRLLHMNPGDNQGVRYELLAICMGLGTDWDEQFLVRDGPLAGKAIDSEPLEQWFRTNAMKFPDELGWWLEWDATVSMAV